MDATGAMRRSPHEGERLLTRRRMLHRRPTYRRVMPNAALFRLALSSAAVLLIMMGVGCQQKSRYATGEDHVASPPLAPLRNDVAVTLPLDIESTPDSQPQALPMRVPLAWRPAVRSRPWQFIVVHHSATHAGGAGRFDQMHRGNGWDELGYHFVIGNGTDTPDGSVEVGSRWRKQKHGAHAKTADNRFNELGIGICLVGNFDESAPTPRQMHALTVLTAHLMQQYRVPASRIIGHGDTKATACPGRQLDSRLASVRRAAEGLAHDHVVANSH